jgi:hypothetical protein
MLVVIGTSFSLEYAVKGTYDRLRPSAKKNVEAAVPRLGRLIEKHT